MMSGLPDGIETVGSTECTACAPLDALNGNAPHPACRLPDHGGRVRVRASPRCRNFSATYAVALAAASPRNAGTSSPLTGALFTSTEPVGSAAAVGVPANTAVTNTAAPAAASTRRGLAFNRNGTVLSFPQQC